METLTLQNVLEAFNAPINEEQAWAVCYQCAKYFNGGSIGRNTQGTIVTSNQRPAPTSNGQPLGGELTRISSNEGVGKRRDRGYSGSSILDGDHTDGVAQSIICSTHIVLGIDGNVTTITGLDETDANEEKPESELVKALGVMVFQALDYGLSASEEQKLSPALEQLIDRMTGSGDVPPTGDGQEVGERDTDGDEGIEDDGDDKEIQMAEQQMTFSDVIEACTRHAEKSTDAVVHYKAVCRALVAEAIELTTFLEKIYIERERLKVDKTELNEDHLCQLEALQRTDWARLWIQIMRELRHGVKLKKVQTSECHPVEYELTPYEILMDDLRYRRYTLNKVELDEDLMPPKVKRDVHDIILEFIRSRPPLHPASSRKLSSPPVKSPDVREQLLESIRGTEHQLKPTPGRIVETSRTKLDESEDTPAISRKLIKPDLSLFLSNSYDDDEDSGDEAGKADDKNKVTADPMPFTPLSPKSPPKHLPWQQTALDLVKIASADKPERRHSITICETPRVRFNEAPKRSLESSLECLSLTIEEVMHIRNVLTKAELECLLVDPELHAQLASGKMCFTCKKTKFALFGIWATNCKFCRRNVCSKCVTKMRIPTEHFEHIPVYTLSPSPSTSSLDGLANDTTGSAPSSPDLRYRHISPPAESTADATFINNGIGKLASLRLATNRFKAPLQRSQTTVRPPPPSQSAGPIPRTLESGPMMNICRDCRSMIVNIIRASRRSLAMAPQSGVEKVYSNCPSRRPSRNFHLDLKPVYKEH